MRHILIALLPFVWAAPLVAEAEYIASYHWTSHDDRFGGLSGIEMSDDGANLIALSDRGNLFYAEVARENGQIIALDTYAPERLSGPGDAPLSNRESDSEGLAIGADGAIFVSFEWVQGMRRMAAIDAPVGPLMTSRDFNAFQSNASLEALAIGADGALYTIPERSGRADRPFPVFPPVGSVHGRRFYHPPTWSLPDYRGGYWARQAFLCP